MSYDGFVYLLTTAEHPTGFNVYDSQGNEILMTVGGGNWGDSIILPVNKGDRLYQWGSYRSQKGRFYKNRDYSNR